MTGRNDPPPELPAVAGAYSHWRAVGTSGVVTSGQVGVDPATGQAADTLAGQVEVAIANLESVLRAAGARLDHVVKTTCFLADIGDFAEFDGVYRRYFTAPFPARSTVGAALVGGLHFEIEAVAMLPDSDRPASDVPGTEATREEG